MEQKESASWISRAKAEADKGASFGDRFTGIVIVFVNVMLIGFFITHQTTSTGFFSSKFGTLEMLLLYGSLVAWIITGSLDGILVKDCFHVCLTFLGESSLLQSALLGS